MEGPVCAISCPVVAGVAHDDGVSGELGIVGQNIGRVESSNSRTLGSLTVVSVDVSSWTEKVRGPAAG